MDTPRVRSSIERITRGLYWEELGRVLPLEFRVTVAIDAQAQPKIRETLGQYFGGRPLRSIGSGVFRYIWNAASDDPLLTMWALEFYHAALFFVIAVNPNGPAAPVPEEQ